jgi:septal ring factor EnvC (AmiA/AmiB activator)
MSGEHADRDLYSDLVENCGAKGETLVRTQNAVLRERVKVQEDEILRLKLQLQETGEENARLREENSTLEKNISCLYKTAVLVRLVFVVSHRRVPGLQQLANY